jgi:hypothetical protein
MGGSRGSRKRDRRPPSCLWGCGTRAARPSRLRAIPMASNSPFCNRCVSCFPGFGGPPGRRLSRLMDLFLCDDRKTTPAGAGCLHRSLQIFWASRRQGGSSHVLYCLLTGPDVLAAGQLQSGLRAQPAPYRLGQARMPRSNWPRDDQASCRAPRPPSRGWPGGRRRNLRSRMHKPAVLRQIRKSTGRGGSMAGTSARPGPSFIPVCPVPWAPACSPGGGPAQARRIRPFPRQPRRGMQAVGTRRPAP